jgi:hypothetical protein
MTRSHTISSVIFVLLAACAGSDKATTEDTDTTTTDDTEIAADSDITSDDTDTTTTDDTDVTPPTAAGLVGVFSAHEPVEACNAWLMSNTIVDVAAVDADSVSISDGTNTFACDLNGTELDCPPVSGTTSNILIGPDAACDWPYTVTVDITDVNADGFTAAVFFATSPSPTSVTCANVLGVCYGNATGTFTRWVPPAPGATPPVTKAMVSAGP